MKRNCDGVSPGMQKQTINKWHLLDFHGHRNKGSSEPLWLLKVMLPSLLHLQVDPEDHLRKETGHHWVFS